MKLRAVKYRITDKLNDVIIFLLGRRWKVILINEYPKCGASWLKYMLGELLEQDGYFINRRKNYLPLIKQKYFIQRHWLKHTRHVYKTIIIIRDPRDVYNSFYFFENYYAANPKKRDFYGFDVNADDKDNMYNYLKSKLIYPHKSSPRFSYITFWDTYKNRKDICFVKYEDLKKDTKGELHRILGFLGFKKNEQSILKSVENHNLPKMKKIEKVSDDRQKLVRKGIVGEWKNYFNNDSITLAKEYLGDMIVEMGYEKSKDW